MNISGSANVAEYKILDIVGMKSAEIYQPVSTSLGLV